MKRASDVFLGVCLIVGLWSWMILSIETEGNSFVVIFLAVSKIIGACFITGPVYREYLR